MRGRPWQRQEHAGGRDPHALKTVCTPAQCGDYLLVARAAAPPEIWASVIAEVPSLEPKRPRSPSRSSRRSSLICARPSSRV